MSDNGELVENMAQAMAVVAKNFDTPDISARGAPTMIAVVAEFTDQSYHVWAAGNDAEGERLMNLLLSAAIFVADKAGLTLRISGVEPPRIIRPS